MPYFKHSELILDFGRTSHIYQVYVRKVQYVEGEANQVT